MKSQKVHNKRSMAVARNYLRKNLTSAEAVLWKYLQRKQLEGRKFRRQHSVGNYIIDFYCPEEKLAIELDGQGHFNIEAHVYDEERTKYLNGLNIRVIRFENYLIFDHIERVLDEIVRNYSNKPPRQPEADTPP